VRPIDKPRRIHRGFDQGIVLKALHGDHGTGELADLSVVGKNGWQHPEISCGIILVRIAKVTGRKGNLHRWLLLLCSKAYSPMKKTTFANEKSTFSLGKVHFCQ
jgi:hypothetical protein